MPKGLRIYWDACVMLSYINADDPSRLREIDAMMAEADRGEIELITSVLSVAEVAYAASERTGRALDAAVLEQIDKLWTPVGPIRLIEFHVLIAETARDIQRSGIAEGWTGLRSVDAMHLATAQRDKVDAFNTYDPALFKWSAKIGLPIRLPLSGRPMLGLGSPPP